VVVIKGVVSSVHSALPCSSNPHHQHHPRRKRHRAYNRSLDSCGLDDQYGPWGPGRGCPHRRGEGPQGEDQTFGQRLMWTPLGFAKSLMIEALALAKRHGGTGSGQWEEVCAKDGWIGRGRRETLVGQGRWLIREWH
jgi:hypothetical protein